MKRIVAVLIAGILCLSGCGLRNKAELLQDTPPECRMLQAESGAEAFDGYDLVLLCEKGVGSLQAAAAESYLQAGGVLAVETTAPNEAISALYALLGRAQPAAFRMEGAQPVGAFLTMNGGALRRGVILQGEVTDRADEPTGLAEMLDADTLLACLEVERHIQREGFADTFSTYTRFRSAKGLGGGLYMSQYVYDRGCTDSGTQIFDLETCAVVAANDKSYVEQYPVCLLADGEATIIEGAYLDGGGTQDQLVLNRFDSSVQFNWLAQPQAKTGGGAWALNPAIRAASPSGGAAELGAGAGEIVFGNQGMWRREAVSKAFSVTIEA